MDTIVARGRILWNSVYEPYEDKLHDKLSSYHPDFMCEYLPRFFPFRFIFHLFVIVFDNRHRSILRFYAGVLFRVRLF